MKTQALLSGSLLVAALLLAVPSGARAGECAISYTRTACKGHEAESYSKCDGKQSCTKSSDVGSQAECQEVALKACFNDRLTITESKIINATFMGKPIKSPTGNDDFCADYKNRSAEFGQCSK